MKRLSELHQIPSTSTSIEKPHRDHATTKRYTKRIDYQNLTPWKAYLHLWSYADHLDVILRTIGIACSFGAGSAYPLMTIIFGDLVNAFNGVAVGIVSPAAFRAIVNDKTLWFVYLFLGRFGLLYTANFLMCFTATKMTRKIRLQYLKTVLHKPVSYFDQHSAGSVATSLSTDTNCIEVGLADKVACIGVATGMVLTAFAIGFWKSWKLTLVVGTTIPWVLTITGILGSTDSKLLGKIKEAQSQASSIAGEALASAANIMALGAKDKIIEKFKKPLAVATHYSILDGPIQASIFGNMFFSMQSGYALALFYGVKLVSNGDIKNGGTVMIVLFCMMMGSSAMGLLAPNIPCFLKAAASAQQVFKTFDDNTPLENTSQKEQKLDHDCVQGSLRFENVTFAYPKRPTIKVLENFSLEILPNQTTAVVGHSGSGKSTLICLLERWYAPDSGSVFLGGSKIEDLDVKWMRSQIGLVQQDPVLFNDTVFQNVLNGLGIDADNLTEKQRREFVVDACKQADAHQFIIGLPLGYDTVVGERGSLFSGGQRQRIAIARSIISNPRILLLDEATSSLDPESENAVQIALDKASHGRTVVIISHKLSTVVRADKIVVINEGRIVEEGTHESLVALNGTYSRLLHAEDLRFQGRSVDKQNKDHIAHDVTEISPLGTEHLPVHLDQANITTDFQSKEIARQYSLFRGMSRMILDTKSIIPTFTGGTLGACVAGSCIPMQAYLFSKLVTVFQLQGAQRINRGNFWALMFFFLALTNLISYAILWLLFAISGSIISMKYRANYLRAILGQDVAFFEQEGNASGALTALLATDGDDLQAMFGFSIALIMVFSIDILACGILSIAISWKLGLVGVFGCFPVLFLAGYFRMRLDASAQDRCASNFLESARFGTEAIEAIRTISSLNMEDVVMERYGDRLRKAVVTSFREMTLAMALFSLSDCVDLLTIALVFWYGGKLVSTGDISVGSFFIVYTAVIFGGQGAGFIFGYSSGISKAQAAANRIIYLAKQEPTINSTTGQPKTSQRADTKIEFRDVRFKYPTRLDVEVLRGMNFEIKRGENVCIVGRSGCGKSTIIQLLERFYDIESGTLLIEGNPISSLDIETFRSTIALVSQETILYQGTIRENLSLGLKGDVDDSILISACQDANIHDFIVSLPEGYETECGSRGLTLSGGQRQRIAIARALLRQPAILLLDEATSALDPESQKLITDSLKKAAKGRTVISISHHTEIMEQADRILVVENGVVIESGKFDDLLSSRGRFWAMQGELMTDG